MSDATLRSVDGYVFDATFVEDHTSELEIPENPTEVGFIIADTAFMKPLEFSLQAGVSDTPLYVPASDPFGAGLGSRSKNALELLQQLQAAAEPFVVTTGLRVYSDMLIKRIKTSQDKDSANALLFTLDLKQVIRVTTQTVTYPPRAASVAKKASAPTNKGEQQANQPSAVKSQSLLAKLFGSGGVFSVVPTTPSTGGQP